MEDTIEVEDIERWRAQRIPCSKIVTCEKELEWFMPYGVTLTNLSRYK